MNEPASVARIGRKDYARAELPPTVWRRQINELARWACYAFIGWLLWAPLLYLALRE